MTPILSPKQRIYQDMLWITLPILRNYATWPWWQRQRYVNMLRLETGLIHNLPLLVTEHDYIDHGPPCEQCGKPLRTPRARGCAAARLAGRRREAG